MTPDTLTRLDTLNNLLAMLAGSDQSVVQEVRKAIRFAAQTASENNPLASLGQGAKRLMKLHWRGYPVAMRHCDLRGKIHDPLWLRSRVLSKLECLEGARDGILLVSGLRESIAATSRRWSEKRESEYAQCRDYVEALCAAEKPYGVRLSVIFI